MAGTAYFGNTVNDTIFVVLNNELGGSKLNPRVLDDTRTTIKSPAASYPIGPNKDKGKFGGRGITNRVRVTFSSLADDALYDIKVTDAPTNSDLYFYIFENSLVGQDQQGRSGGIVITPVDGPTPPMLKSSAKGAETGGSKGSTKKK
jgi:hypothetical protein